MPAESLLQTSCFQCVVACAGRLISLLEAKPRFYRALVLCSRAPFGGPQGARLFLTADPQGDRYGLGWSNRNKFQAIAFSPYSGVRSAFRTAQDVLGSLTACIIQVEALLNLSRRMSAVSVVCPAGESR